MIGDDPNAAGPSTALPTQPERLERISDLAESRRQGNVALVWAVPSLVMAAQAFLFGAAFNAEVSRPGRIVALAFGGVFAATALTGFAAHLRYGLAYERVLNSALGYRVDGAQFDAWASASTGQDRRTFGSLGFVRRGAAGAWAVALGATVLLDLALIAITLAEPGWLV